MRGGPLFRGRRRGLPPRGYGGVFALSDPALRGTLLGSMLTTARWLNDYLDPPASAEELAELLTHAGFPCEGSEEVAVSDGTDTRLDIELTSNRGDCACHLGLAREAAAISKRTLNVPSVSLKATGPSASSIVSVTNKEPELCPLYTARIIRGVKVGPSPKWLADRISARGDIPRNNLVDLTNFVLFELGQPTHVFDLAKLKGPEIIIRRAREHEPFLPIGEGAEEVKLRTDDLVIADREDAVAIAGVKGGALTAVRDSTTDILIETATFSPLTVRNTSRRLGIASDSSYRFEREVHPGQIGAAADRLCALILELCGGELCEGEVADGRPIPQRRNVSMRCDRCRALLGVPIDDETMRAYLDRLGFEPKLTGGRIDCTVPYVRNDIDREADLIEEVGRMFGHENIPIAEKLEITVAPPQSTVLATRAVHDALVGMGYVETVTHSLIGERHASAFLPPDMHALKVDDERAKAEPVLRPSILPSLLRVFALNRDNGVPDVKLFETAATFAQAGDSHIERVNLALLHPAKSPDAGVRQARGVIDRLSQIILGPEVEIDVQPLDRELKWFAPGGAGFARANGDVLGTFGALSSDVLRTFGIEQPLYAAEIGLPAYYDRFPPETEAHALPSFPAIERDVSAILDETVLWRDVRAEIESLSPEHLEKIEFVTTFRGKQIGAGKKSLTLRLRFRAPDRTLKHGDVDTQMAAVVGALEARVGAVIRK